MCPRSRRRKLPKRKSALQPKKSEIGSGGLKYKVVQPTFGEPARERALRSFIESSHERASEFERAFSELQGSLATSNPIDLLAIFSFYSLLGSNKQLLRKQPPPPPGLILQHHVELLQGLILSRKREEFSGQIVAPSTFDRINELAHKVTYTFGARRYARLDPLASDQERRRVGILEEMRTHTQFFRNWGYAQQIREIVVGVFAPLDDEIERRMGVRVSSLVDMCFSIARTVQERFTKHYLMLAPVYGAKNLRAMVARYHEVMGLPDTLRDELLQLLKEHGAGVREAKSLLIAHGHQRLVALFTFTVNDFVEAYLEPVDHAALLRVLHRWSLAFGDLADENPEHLFMGNPVWSRPMIKLNEDVATFFVPVIGLFVSFCLEMMEAIIEEEPDLCERYQARRGVFLEDETERLFRDAFPTSKVFRGSQWYDPTTHKWYENDLLILIDSYMIVVEAKAGKVSPQASRGAELSLQRNVKELIIEPSEQAGRFVEHLLKNRGLNHLPTRRGTINEVDNTHIHETVRINVTLDMLANVQSNWTELRKAGFVPQGANLAPTMSLADLETVFELLGSACEKLHYLVRRTELERNTSYFADEIDLLAFYIDTGFNIGEIEFDEVRMFLYGASEFLELYLVRVWSGQSVAKPRRRYTKWWDALLVRMESQPVPRWTECGYLLLNMTHDEQVHFEREFRRVQRIVRSRASRCNNTDGGDTFIMPYGPERRRNLLVGFAYEGITKAERDEAMTNAAMVAFRGQPADRALVLGMNLEQRDKSKPYSVMGCFSRPDKDTGP